MMIAGQRSFRLLALMLTGAATAACRVDDAPVVRRGADTADAARVVAAPPVAETPPSGPSTTTATTATTATTEPTRRPPAARTSTGPRRVVVGGIDLTGIGYDRGSVTAPVVMIDLSDFSCPYCGEFSRETYPTIERDYVKTGKVFFKYVPFVVGSFPNSREATRATECAADQDGFWPMMNLVYEAQREWRKSRDPYPLLSGIASVAGLDTARLGACYASRQTDARTARATGVADDLGVRVTPSFIVDERPIQGALPLAEFRKVLDAALMVRGMSK